MFPYIPGAVDSTTDSIVLPASWLITVDRFVRAAATASSVFDWLAVRSVDRRCRMPAIVLVAAPSTLVCDWVTVPSSWRISFFSPLPLDAEAASAAIRTLLMNKLTFTRAEASRMLCAFCSNARRSGVERAETLTPLA